MNQQSTKAIQTATVRDAWAGVMLDKLDQDPIKAFEHDVGYVNTFEVYHARLKSILTAWLDRDSSDPFRPAIRKPLEWGDWDLVLCVDQGRRPGSFNSLDAGRQKALCIEAVSLSGRAVHRVEWGAVDEIMTELIRSVAVTFEKAWFLFGSGWVPQGIYRSRGTATTLKPGMDDVHEDELAIAPPM